jgi:pyruvate,orthophosphate dikinase
LTAFAKLFDEAVGLDRFQLGGKGFGLVEMSTIGLPVPPGFVVPTEACRAYYSSGGKMPDGLMDEVLEKMTELEQRTGKKLGDPNNPLLVSVRSGAPFSMPGMMDTILNLGLNDQITESMAKRSRNERFAYDAYRRLIQMFGKVAMEVRGEFFEEILQKHKDQLGAKLDVELPAEEMKKIVREYKELVKRESGKDFPQDPQLQLRMAIEAVFGSWNNDRAREYRRFYKIRDDLGTAVNIQTMVFGNMGANSGSGVGFTRNPSTGEKKLYGEYLSNSQGEDVVAGIRTPTSIDDISSDLKEQLLTLSKKLEKHFRDMQDFEFTVEDGKLYMLQTRNGKRTAEAAVKVATDMVAERLITKEEAIARVSPNELTQLLHRRLDPKAKFEPIAKGLNASPGAASGRVIFETEEAASLGAKGISVILVRPETTPEDIKGIIASQGVLTVRGGMTSHAAVVARGMGKPAIVGCSEIRLYPDQGYFETKSGDQVKKDDVVTIDGTTGLVIKGEVPTVEQELTPEFRELLSWADEARRLGVWANADTPEAARKAREFGAEGIGLCRTERMFNAPDRLPIVKEMIMATDQEKFIAALNKLLPFQLQDFKEIFRVMKGKPVIVRLLDLPLHEFLPPAEEILSEMLELQKTNAPKETIQERLTVLNRVRQLSEHNPMLGHRGCRLAITHPEIYQMQTKAILKAALDIRDEEGETVKVKIMLPLVSNAREMETLRRVVEESAEMEFKEVGKRIEFQIGSMIETPRAALTADELAKYADFFSFGTNDLTQNTFAFSRDDVEAKFMTRYLEEKILPDSPFETFDVEGVGKLVKMAVEKGRSINPELEVGICGEHGGEPRSVKFFHEAGLDYVSCSAYSIPIARLAAAQAALAKTKISVTA